MSLCLSANAANLIETAKPAPGLVARLRRALLAFAPAEPETGDLMPAPVVARADRAVRRRPGTTEDINALLL